MSINRTLKYGLLEEVRHVCGMVNMTEALDDDAREKVLKHLRKAREIIRAEYEKEKENDQEG